MRNAECGMIVKRERQDLKARTFEFALRVVKMCTARRWDWRSADLYKQLLRSGTSVGANYRAAARARSTAEFIAKLGIVEEECDESIYWMELLREAGLLSPKRSEPLLAEANELLAITIASIKTAKANSKS